VNNNKKCKPLILKGEKENKKREKIKIGNEEASKAKP